MNVDTATAILTVDLDALAANWRLLDARLGTATCGAVVKADAYGLGAARVALALYHTGCRTFFVALVDEGIALRAGLPDDATIHVLHGPLPGAETACLEHRLLPVLNSLDQIERWQLLARRRGVALRAALQVDTGMSRLGLSVPQLRHLLSQPERLEGIELGLLISHLVSAEHADAEVNQQQQQLFAALAGELRRRHPRVRASLANSSGIFLGRHFHFDLARPGAALYGVAPIAQAANPMRPVVRLQARMIQWRDIDAGDGVGYNHTWHASRPARVATLSLGYADGYLRSLSNRAEVRFMGAALRLVGRVSMDTVTVDVSSVPAATLVPGALFDLIDEVADVNVLAEQAGTNAYEILTSLGARYRRVYLDSGAP
jgi:alanine racemase